MTFSFVNSAVGTVAESSFDLLSRLTGASVARRLRAERSPAADVDTGVATSHPLSPSWLVTVVGRLAG